MTGIRRRLNFYNHPVKSDRPTLPAISLIGVYATSLSLFSVGISVLFGIIGYLMLKFELPRAPIVLAPLMKRSLRQSLMLSSGSLMILIERPISAVLSLVVLTTLLLPVVRLFRHRRQNRPSQK